MIQPMNTNQLLKTNLHLHQKNNESQELEAICKNLSETKTNMKRIPDNIPNIRDILNSLMTKIRSNEILIKPADIGSKVVVMSSDIVGQCANHI